MVRFYSNGYVLYAGLKLEYMIKNVRKQLKGKEHKLLFGSSYTDSFGSNNYEVLFYIFDFNIFEELFEYV